jgi:hypothetical protein
MLLPPMAAIRLTGSDRRGYAAISGGIGKRGDIREITEIGGGLL